jgi:hypothetical protein
MNFILIIFKSFSGYLGLQWRNLREIGIKLGDINRSLPSLSNGEKVTFPLENLTLKVSQTLQSLSVDNPLLRDQLLHDLKILSSYAELEKEYTDLLNKRKELQSQSLRDKHFGSGSILLGVGVVNAIYGALNSYWGSGELYPDSHLFAGATISSLWAMSASLVPLMQKGNEAARIGHIALNSVNVILFTWQVVTGLDILGQVWEVTKWP